MIWFTWRQHRSEALLALGVLVVGGAYLLITGLAMAHTLQDSGLGTCLAQHPESIGTSGPCGFLAGLFLNQYGPFIPFVAALRLLPILLGVMVGRRWWRANMNSAHVCCCGCKVSPAPAG